MSLIEAWYFYRPHWHLKFYIIMIFLALFFGIVCLYFYRAAGWVRHRCIAAWLLFVYVAAVLTDTVFARETGLVYKYKLRLFWSYTEALKTQGVNFLWEIGLNVILLLPLGILFPVASGKKDVVLTATVGMAVSVAIEVLQLLLKRGLFEFDDIFHNTLGVIVGYLVYRMIMQIYSKMQKISRRNDTVSFVASFFCVRFSHPVMPYSRYFNNNTTDAEMEGII